MNIEEEDNCNFEKEYEVEKIIKDRKRHRRNEKTGEIEFVQEYLVKWVGYKKKTWEPLENFEHSQEILKEYLDKKEDEKKTNKKERIKKIKKKNEKVNEEVEEDKSDNSNFIKDKHSQYVTGYYNHLIGNKRAINENGDDPSTLSSSVVYKKKDSKLRSDVVEEVDTNFDIEILDESDNEEQENNLFDIYNDNDGDDIVKESSTNKIFAEPVIINELKSNEKESVLETKKKGKRGRKKKINRKSDDIMCNDDKVIDIGQNNYSDHKNETDEKISLNFTEKKMFGNDNECNNNNNKEENELKILEINKMEIPANSEKGITLNIKYSKQKKIYIDEFNTKSDNLPSSYLIKYYEMFIFDHFKGQNCSWKMSFC